MIKLSALTPYVVVADGVVGVYRTASAVKAVIPTFEAWVAYDVTGWRVELTGGRTWHPFGIEVGVLPRLLPVAEPPALDAVRELLATALDRPSSIRDGSSLRATIYCFPAHIGWRDDDAANCVPAERVDAMDVQFGGSVVGQVAEDVVQAPAVVEAGVRRDVALRRCHQREAVTWTVFARGAIALALPPLWALTTAAAVGSVRAGVVMASAG